MVSSRCRHRHHFLIIFVILAVEKLWDPRKPVQLREYKQHFDFISDFMWLEDKRQLVATR